MSDQTHTWWKSESGEDISLEEKLERLQRFFADNGEAIYGKPKTEKTVILEKTPFTIPNSYDTTLPDLKIIPMWAGKEVGWNILK